MPELPEVEVSRQGISPYLCGNNITKIVVRDARLRWPIPETIHQLEGHIIQKVTRRGKYLLFETAIGTSILHLGMSGSLRIMDIGEVVNKHDHLDIELSNGKLLRLNDPRRFGAFLWTQAPWAEHKLLAKLGPEPLSDDFDGQLLFERSRKRSLAIKNFIMNAQVVVGVGNIYANEALFRAGILPTTATNKVSKKSYLKLAKEIKIVLAEAIKQGGTTLKDFTSSNGKPGYFAQQLHVYGREGEACSACENKIEQIKIGNRATYFCSRCQK